jgi:Uma2 family endonuclease
MTTVVTRRRPFTRPDFLAWESRQEERWEFVDGVIRMMAGGTVAHNTIAGNIFAALHAALRHSACRPFQQNMKLTPAANDDSTYPDVMVVCGAVEDSDATLSEAVVIAEVVSKSSREDDYDRKWESYQMIPTLRHYLIVEQDRVSVALYSRMAEDGGWQYQHFDSLEQSVALSSINVTLGVDVVYDGVKAGQHR